MQDYINHGLLRVARQRQGFSQGEASDLLGVPQVSLSRYENAVQTPNDDFLAKASHVYDLPLSFFQQADPVFGAPVSVHPMWRKKHDVTTRELDKIVAEINIRVMHIRRLLEGVELTPQTTIPKLDPEDYMGDIERIASTVRAHWLVPSGPIQNLCALVEKAGAIVIHSAMGETSVSGVTMSVPGMPSIIILNSDQPADRARFTLAHELGHIVMHRFPNPEMEQEANAFAAALLMPINEIKVALAGRLDIRRLAALKPEWKVSMAALLHRAQSLKLVTTNQATYLWKQFNVMRIKMREPAELDFPHETPGVLTKMIKLHLEHFGYGLNDLAKMLHVNERSLKSYYDITDGNDKSAGHMKFRVIK